MTANRIDARDGCPLCGHYRWEAYFADRIRSYRHCPRCRLVYVPRTAWLSLDAERAEYDRHENDPRDPGYRRFLSRLCNPLLARLPPGQLGLDFGCGPGPALAVIMEANGHRMDLYDPIYYNEASIWERSYDFICATEVVEHLREPERVFADLFRILKPGGWIGIMTKLVRSAEAFATWHYIRDRTHICFYSLETFGYVARRFDAGIEFIGKDVILLHRRPKVGVSDFSKNRERS